MLCIGASNRKMGSWALVTRAAKLLGSTVHRVSASHGPASSRRLCGAVARCAGEGNGSPLQCSRLENPRDGGAGWAAVYGVTQSRT